MKEDVRQVGDLITTRRNGAARLVISILSPGLEVLKQRLQSRWTDHELDPQTALERVSQNDLPNAELVLRQSGPADVVLEQTWSSAGAPVSQNP